MPLKAAHSYIACVSSALRHLHCHCSVAFRDLKLENIVLDARGYAKLVDLGFAIHLPNGARAETRCGSPEYMAPEVHSGQPHGLTVDLWALGVLAFELRTASTPFFDERGIMAIARKSRKGILTGLSRKPVT